MDKSKIHSPKNVPIKETGNATAGTMTLLIFPKKRKIIRVTSTKAIANVFHISKIAAFTYVLRSNETFKLSPSGRFFSIFFILFFILSLNSTMLAESLAYKPIPTILSSGFVFLPCTLNNTFSFSGANFTSAIFSRRMTLLLAVSYTHLTLPTILLV